MQLTKAGNNISAVYRGSTAIGAVYRGTELVHVNPRALLFSNGEAGVWYDPSDLSTMFTDTAGTTPATVGDPVARINDKSGNDIHATQATTAKRPILRQTPTGEYYLEFDGVDDTLTATNIDFSGTDKMSVFAGIRKVTDAANGILLELGDVAPEGSFTLAAPPGDLTGYFWRTRGSASPVSIDTATPAAPVTNVLTGTGDIGADEMELRIDGLPAGVSSSDQGAGNFGSYPLYIGSRQGFSLEFNGHLYGLIIRGASSAATEINNTEAYLAAKTGVTL